MLPQVPQTRRWPALRTELSLKSPPHHTAVLHSCLVPSRVCGKGRSESRSTAVAFSGADSTRFHQTEMVRPAVGAATTERWSVRGPWVRTTCEILAPPQEISGKATWPSTVSGLPIAEIGGIEGRVCKPRLIGSNTLAPED